MYPSTNIPTRGNAMDKNLLYRCDLHPFDQLSTSARLLLKTNLHYKVLFDIICTYPKWHKYDLVIIVNNQHEHILYFQETIKYTGVSTIINIDKCVENITEKKYPYLTFTFIMVLSAIAAYFLYNI